MVPGRSPLEYRKWFRFARPARRAELRLRPTIAADKAREPENTVPAATRHVFHFFRRSRRRRRHPAQPRRPCASEHGWPAAAQSRSASESLRRARPWSSQRRAAEATGLLWVARARALSAPAPLRLLSRAATVLPRNPPLRANPAKAPARRSALAEFCARIKIFRYRLRRSDRVLKIGNSGLRPPNAPPALLPGCKNRAA